MAVKFSSKTAEQAFLAKLNREPLSQSDVKELQKTESPETIRGILAEYATHFDHDALRLAKSLIGNEAGTAPQDADIKPAGRGVLAQLVDVPWHAKLQGALANLPPELFPGQKDVSPAVEQMLSGITVPENKVTLS